MADNKKELEGKLLKAASSDEVRDLLSGEGVDAGAAESIFAQVEALRNQGKLELSLQEMEAVGGGNQTVEEMIFDCSSLSIRKYSEYGCAATVEQEDSNCWGVDGGCSLFNIQYIP